MKYNNFSRKVLKINWNKDPFTKIRPVGVDVLYLDRQTDRKKETVTFQNFVRTQIINGHTQSIHKGAKHVLIY